MFATSLMLDHLRKAKTECFVAHSGPPEQRGLMEGLGRATTEASSSVGNVGP
jgi:hypothetical protein